MITFSTENSLFLILTISDAGGIYNDRLTGKGILSVQMMTFFGGSALEYDFILQIWAI